MPKEERLEQLKQDKELKQILTGEINEYTSQEERVDLNHSQNESYQENKKESQKNSKSPLVDPEEQEPAMPLVNSEEGQPLTPLTEPHQFHEEKKS
ncbi:hypothetical protein [uncultured Vagococcus sp.]|uniref:hypothetical protein n=1 Tax=uncultured Vagococcus sp. TaxID=189676 RepID=UPI0028D33B8D|nr:hypothetical protein [uncultured Vagococcus sp.]